MKITASAVVIAQFCIAIPKPLASKIRCRIARFSGTVNPDLSGRAPASQHREQPQIPRLTGAKPVNMSNPKPERPATNLLSDAPDLGAAADQAKAACGGDAREAVNALLVVNEFL
jgi:hypothetical protein